MEHFPEQVWADFVRGIGNSNSAELESHLAEACNECAATLRMWKQMYAIASCEDTYSPPENAVRMVKLEFMARHFQEAKAIQATLTFDTLSQPALAGVRSTVANARQVVYEADGLTVDLRFDRHADSKRLDLIGQVLDTRVPRASLGDIAVMLWTENGLPIAETETNKFGEFSLEYEEQDCLTLSIHGIDRPLIRIPVVKSKVKRDVDGIAGGSASNY